jgi:hypothetical protein
MKKTAWTLSALSGLTILILGLIAAVKHNRTEHAYALDFTCKDGSRPLVRDEKHVGDMTEKTVYCP